VKKSYFKGNYYLIEANFSDKTIFFNHSILLEKGENYYLKISEKD